MKNKKGFISTSIIYSFFLVFILLMIAILMSYVNKRYLIDKVSDNFNTPGGEVLGCEKTDTLVECLFKNEYIEHMNATYFNSVGFVVNDIKDAISSRTSPNLSIAADKEDGMYATTDDYGTTYYYRGAEDDNYVKFNGMLWRIIRIDGNSNIRLIYNDVIDINRDNQITEKYDAKHFNSDKASEFICNTYSDILSNTSVNRQKLCDRVPESERDNLLKWACNNMDKTIDNYKGKVEECGGTDDSGATSLWNIGYMKNGKSTIKIAEKLENNSNSDLLEYINIWFENNNFDDYLNKELSTSAVFCGNKDIVTEKNLLGITVTKSGNNCVCLGENHAKILERKSGTPCGEWGWWKNDNDPTIWNKPICGEAGYNFGYQVDYFNNSATYILENKPTSLKCYNNVSKYVYPSKTNTDNGQLYYPISTITASEMIFAGFTYYNASTNNYLNIDYDFWTSDLAFGGNKALSYSPDATYYFAYKNGKLDAINDETKEEVAYIRPVISIDSSVKYISGIGTIDDPYIIGE